MGLFMEAAGEASRNKSERPMYRTTLAYALLALLVLAAIAFWAWRRNNSRRRVGARRLAVERRKYREVQAIRKGLLARGEESDPD